MLRDKVLLQTRYATPTHFECKRNFLRRRDVYHPGRFQVSLRVPPRLRRNRVVQLHEDDECDARVPAQRALDEATRLEHLANGIRRSKSMRFSRSAQNCKERVTARKLLKERARGAEISAPRAHHGTIYGRM